MYHLEIIWHQLVNDKVECDSLINIGGQWSTANYKSCNYIIMLIILWGLDLSLMQKQEIKLCEPKCTVHSQIILFKGLDQNNIKTIKHITLLVSSHVDRFIFICPCFKIPYQSLRASPPPQCNRVEWNCVYCAMCNDFNLKGFFSSRNKCSCFSG